MAFTEKAKKILKQRSFLFTLALTILGFICIPLLALQSFVITQSTDEFQKTNHQYYLSTLRSSASTFASREQVLSQTALRISLNDIIQKPLRHPSSEYALYEAAQEISNYGAEVLYVKNVGVYYASEGYLLTNGNKYLLTDYCDMHEPASREYSKRLRVFFEELDCMDYHATSDGKTLYAARPISLGAAGRNDAIAFFVMDAAALEESLRASISLHASFAIIDEAGHFLLQGSDFVENIHTPELNSFLSSGSNVCTAGAKKDLLLYRHTDPESGLTFLLSVDKDASEGRLVDFAKLLRTTMYGMILLMVISLSVTIYINYRPIYQLLKKHTGKEPEQKPHSEIELLDSAFFKLDEKMSNQQNLLKDFILGDLLFGNAVKPELINQYFPSSRYQSFAVMTTLCPSLNSTQSLQLADRITEATGHSIYITSVPSRPHTIIVCLAETQIHSLALHDHTIRAIADVFGMEYPLCTGQIVTDIHELRASYRGAVTAHPSPNANKTDATADDFSKMLHLLSQCVYVGDEAEAQKYLADIRAYLYNNIMGEGHLRYHCFQLLHSYLDSINSNEAHLSAQDIELLLSFTGTDHLFKLLGESVQQVCAQVADTERSVDIQIQQRLLTYVDTNFKNSELCLTSAADHIGVSIYAVSRLFKEVTGTGFKEYVTEKRLEYGHMLLCTTQKSIAEISAAAGFENANYFSTVFKLKYGMPPTKYRNIQKEKQSV